MLMKKIESVEDEIRLWFPNYKSYRERSLEVSHKSFKKGYFRGIDISVRVGMDKFYKYFENTDTTTDEGWSNYRKFVDNTPLIKELQKSKWKMEDRITFFHNWVEILPKLKNGQWTNYKENKVNEPIYLDDFYS